ncbi:restriction endonuclease [Bifidobacterium longum subsp. longum]|mgnify:CR=1 FL=1|uniref:restriction endonuclease n=1 Tax=Bifidobacterium longum TaxID=216816 RepID=UPI003568E385
MEVILFIVVVVIAFYAYRAYMRSKFAGAFNISAVWLKRCIVGKISQNNPTGFFQLNYPMWEASNNDGTRDKRTNDTRIIDAWSELTIGGWRVRSKSPIELYSVVTALRAAGHDVALIPREQTKMTGASVIYSARQATSVMDLVRAFFNQKDMFRSFCIEMCRANGYFVTESSKPGFDFYAELGGVTGLVACSCLNVSSNVGLPAIRQLSDANVLEGMPEMMYITTGGFSSQAISFASRENIHLIDGSQLLGMVHAAWGSSAAAASNIPYTEYTLTQQELEAGYPSDMQRR